MGKWKTTMIWKAIHMLLAVAALSALVLGVVSYWKGAPDETLWISSVRDTPRVQLAMIDGVLHAVHSAPREQQLKGDTELEFGPFYLKRVIFGGTVASGAGAPFWSLFPLLMVCPVIAFTRGPLRRYRRRRRGQCVDCGYILRGLPEPRCPECGREFTPSTICAS